MLGRLLWDRRRTAVSDSPAVPEIPIPWQGSVPQRKGLWGSVAPAARPPLFRALASGIGLTLQCMPGTVVRRGKALRLRGQADSGGRWLRQCRSSEGLS